VWLWAFPKTLPNFIYRLILSAFSAPRSLLPYFRYIITPMVAKTATRRARRIQ
jgi:hypothetical protein